MCRETSLSAGRPTPEPRLLAQAQVTVTDGSTRIEEGGRAVAAINRTSRSTIGVSVELRAGTRATRRRPWTPRVQAFALMLFVACAGGDDPELGGWTAEFCSIVGSVYEAGASIGDEDDRLPLDQRISSLDEDAQLVDDALSRAISDLRELEPPDAARSYQEATLAFYQAFSRAIELTRSGWLAADTEADYQAAADQLSDGVSLAETEYATAVTRTDRSIVAVIARTPGCAVPVG